MQTAPWHYWVIGILALIWTGIGAADYVMTQYDFAPYTAFFTENQRTYLAGLPKWVEVTWALAVWLSLAGALMYLLRIRMAPICYGLAIVFIFATFVHVFLLAEIPLAGLVGPLAVWFAPAIIGIALLLWLDARATLQSGFFD